MSGTIVVPASGATFPGSGTQTFAQIKSDIARLAGLLDDPGMEQLAGRFLNDIIDDLNRRQVWIFNLVTSPDITTASGTLGAQTLHDFVIETRMNATGTPVGYFRVWLKLPSDPDLVKIAEVTNTYIGYKEAGVDQPAMVFVGGIYR